VEALQIQSAETDKVVASEAVGIAPFQCLKVRKVIGGNVAASLGEGAEPHDAWKFSIELCRWWLQQQ